MRKQFVRSIVCALFGLAILVGATGTARAEWKPNSMEVGIYSPYEFFDNKAVLDDNFGYGARFGYKFTKGHEVEVGWNDLPTKVDAGSKPGADFTTLYFGYLYNWTGRKALTPFATVGIGHSRFHVKGFGSETDPSYYVGGGARFYFHANFNLRLEADYQRLDTQGPSPANWIVGIGVGWTFGGK